MKRFLAVTLCVAVFLSVFTMGVSAAKSYEVPKAFAAPTIDGVINSDEWANALVVEMKAGDTTLAFPAGEAAQFLGCTIRFMWADEGIYFAADVKDETPATVSPVGNSGSYNSGDGVQFNMFPTRETPSENKKIFFFSYHPKTDDGKAYVGEHFVYGTGDAGANVPEAKIASVVNATNYIVEGLIPAEALKKSETPMTVASGAKLLWNNVIMDEGGGKAQGLMCDGEWFAAAGANEYTLIDTLAGPVPQAEATTAAGAAETPTPAPANPTTGDSGIAVLMAMMALAAAGAYVFSAKRAK